MGFARISEQRTIISLYSINVPAFVSDAECLQRGTDWVFKSDRYIFVLKRLNSITASYVYWTVHHCYS